MLRKIVLSIAILLCVQVCVYSYSPEQLANMEMVKYGQSYENDSLSSRLMRLETDLFGMTQSGDIDSRLDMISQMIGSSASVPAYTPDNSYYSQNNSYYYPQKKESAIKRFWNNLTDDFSSGAITGFTPPLTSTGYVNDLYGNGFMNFTNNSGRYCPLHNTYHNNGFFNNNPHNFWNGRNRYHNAFNRGHNFRHPLHLGRNPYYTNFNSYANPYGYYGNRIPTNTYNNVLSRSTVHILQD